MRLFVLLAVFAFLQACSQQEVFTANSSKQVSHSEKAAEAVAVSHDGTLSIVAIPTEVCVWNNLNDKLQLPCLKGESAKFVELVGISENNAYFFTSNQVVVRLYKVANGKQVGEWQLADNIINDIAISESGNVLLLGFRNGLAAVIDVKANQISSHQKHRLDINSVGLSANGKLALTGSADKSAHLWDTKTGETLHSFDHKSRVNHVTISDDGKVGLTLDAIEAHTIWDLSSGEEISTLDTHLRFFEFNHARFSSDNTLLLAGLPKRKVQLWRVKDGVKLAEWYAHQQRARASVLGVAFDKDGNAITENSDGMLEIWPMPELNQQN